MAHHAAQEAFTFDHHHPVLVLESNYYNALSVIRQLGKLKIPFTIAEYDFKSYSLSSKYAKNTLKIPNPKSEAEACVKVLINWAKEQKTKPVLFPTHDNCMLLVDRHYAELEPYFLMTLPAPGLAERIMKKNTLEALAREQGLNLPKTVDLNGLSRPEQVERIRAELSFPLLIKPIASPAFVSHFRRKLFEVHDEKELLDVLQRIEEAKTPCVAQQIIRGDDEQMRLADLYLNHKHQAIHRFTGQKLRQWPIHYGASCLMHGFVDPQLEQIAVNFLEHIEWRGFAEIEFKVDSEDHKPYIIEVNARFTNFNEYLEQLGFPVTLSTYLDATGQALPPAYRLRENPDSVFCYTHESIRARWHYLKDGSFSKAHLKAQARHKKVYAIWSWRDPLPFFTYFWRLAQKHLKH